MMDLPDFPRFRRLSFEQKSVIDGFVERYSPYSEFTFGNMWCWDLDDSAALSLLNGNLVLRYREYESGLPYLTFLGENERHKTALTLLKYAGSEFGRPLLGLVPEHSVSRRRAERVVPLRVQEDRDNFDYVLDLESLASFAGPSLRRKRQASAHFGRTYAPVTRDLDLATSQDQTLALSTFAGWSESRGIGHERSRDELAALRRIFDVWHTGAFVATGIIVDATLVAFSICETLPNHFAGGLFFKADASMRGSFEYLRQTQARHLLQRGRRWISIQQDMGLPGLRQAKLSYRPAGFLQKYTLRWPECGELGLEAAAG